MGNTDKLYLQEEILLLALKDYEGTIASGSTFMYAVGGAILSELLMCGRIEVDQLTKRKLLKVIDSKPTGDRCLDECLERMDSSKSQYNMQGWLAKFAYTKRLKDLVADGLVRRGILKADEGRVLLLFTRKTYPEIDPMPERAIIERMRRVIFDDSKKADAHTLLLISLARSAHLLTMVFDKRDLKERKHRLDDLVAQEPTGKAATQAIQAAQAAVAMMVVIPTVINS
jgi:hypothetical protein